MKINKVNGYHNYAKNGKTAYVHREVWKEHHGEIPKGMQIHHINSNKDDNRIENLSMVTNAQNMQQSDRWGKGWTYMKRNTNRPYRATRRLDKHTHVYIGAFGTPCGAYMASRMAYVSQYN